MFDHLFINGCSHTAGSEIEGSGIGEGNYNRENCYSAQIAKKLGWKYTNIAMPGGSNDYIKRTTLLWILDNFEKAKTTHFFINWTGAERTEYFYDHWDRNRYNLNKFIPYTPDKKVLHLHPQHYPDWAPVAIRKNLDALSEHLFINPIQWQVNRYMNIIELQSFLKAHNLSYTFRNSFQACENSKRYKYYADKIDKDNFLYWDDENFSFFENCLNQGHSVEGQMYWHHRLPAHTYWANELWESNFKLYSSNHL